jgi:hypothetical protein
MSTLKVRRETIALAEAAGLTVLETKQAESGHQKIRVRSADGRERCFTFGVSSSDHRAVEMRKKDFRLFVRGVY